MKIQGIRYASRHYSTKASNCARRHPISLKIAESYLCCDVWLHWPKDFFLIRQCETVVKLKQFEKICVGFQTKNDKTDQSIIKRAQNLATMALQLEPICYGTVTKLCLPYEIFGQGHIRLLFLPGMALSRKMWYNQILHFAQKPNYTVLVIENRGNGEVRNKKIQSWSTKAMARDVVRALDELRWTQDKSVHVCGMSMGGMISLQLALLAPKRIASLCLTSTCASWRPPPWSAKNAFAHATLGVTMSEEKKLQLILDTGFPKEHLDAPNARRHLPSITNRDR